MDAGSLYKALEVLPLALWTVDHDLCVTSAAGGALRRLGLGAEGMKDLGLERLFAASGAPPLAAHREALAGRAATFEIGWSGGLLLGSVAPLLDARGAVTGALGVAVDATRERQKGAALEGLVAALPEPLAAMERRCNLLLARPWDGEEGEALRAILTEVRKLSRLAEQCLPAELDANTMGSVPGPGSSPPSPDGKETVLLVEDDDAVRSLLERYLGRKGYRVLVAAEGGQAEELFDAEPEAVDVLLTDLVMPGTGGHELAKRLLRQRPELKVLFMSGYAEAANGGRAPGAERDGTNFLQKPFSPEHLARRLRLLLDGKS